MAEQQQSKRAGEEPKQGVGSGGDKAGEDRGAGRGAGTYHSFCVVEAELSRELRDAFV